jgi:flagellar biogenesis protein FliO
LKDLNLKKVKSFNRNILIGVIVLLILSVVFSGSFNTIESLDSNVSSEQETNKNSRPNYPALIVRVTLLTAIAGLCTYIFVRYYKNKIQPINATANIEVLGKHYINTKQHLLIVRIDKRKMVLGVSDSSINFLTELDSSNEPEKAKSKPRQFKDVLNKLDPN